jgi:hypothetical protein
MTVLCCSLRGPAYNILEWPTLNKINLPAMNQIYFAAPPPPPLQAREQEGRMLDQNTNFATKHTDSKTNKSTMTTHTDITLKTKQEEIIKALFVAPE